MFDLHKKCWIIPTVTGTVTARFFHTATVYDDKLFIYGGIGESETGPRVLGELQYLDLKTFKWSKPYKVPPRFEHSAAVINDTVWIYGGYIEENERFICQRDLMSIQLLCNKVIVTRHVTACNKIPELHFQHFCEGVGDLLVVFGNILQDDMIHADEYKYEAWALNINTMCWSRLGIAGTFHGETWNYFTIITESLRTHHSLVQDISHLQESSQYNHTEFWTADPDSSSPVSLVVVGSPARQRQYRGLEGFREIISIPAESLKFLYSPRSFIRDDWHMALTFNKKELSVCKIHVNQSNNDIYVLEGLIALRCPNLYESFRNETHQKTIAMEEPPEVVNTFLDYLYTDTIPEKACFHTIKQVMLLGDKYGLKRLKFLCALHLYNRKSFKRAIEIYQTSLIAHDQGLEEVLIEYIFDNFGEVVDTDGWKQLTDYEKVKLISQIPRSAFIVL
jgi:hypothetical protein